MSPKQKLEDLIALCEALQSQRRHLITARGNRGWRAARVRAAVKTIRACRASILVAFEDIHAMRDRDSMAVSIEKLDVRISELKGKIARLDKSNSASKIAEKIKRMQAQLRAMNAELPAEFRLEDIL